MSTPILTVNQLRTTYGLASINETTAAKFEALIEAATTAVFEFIGRDREVGSFVQYFDGGVQQFVLNHTPVASVVGVYVDPDRLYATALGSAEYRLDTSSGVLTVYTNVPDAVDVVRVSYTAGWATVPDDILYCIAMTVQHMAIMSQSNRAGVESRSVDGGTETLDQNIPPLAIQRHLAMYKRNRVL
jgi:hypothetical protein